LASEREKMVVVVKAVEARGGMAALLVKLRGQQWMACESAWDSSMRFREGRTTW